MFQNWKQLCHVVDAAVPVPLTVFCLFLTLPLSPGALPASQHGVFASASHARKAAATARLTGTGCKQPSFHF